jgi:ankyrin repeat protein
VFSFAMESPAEKLMAEALDGFSPCWEDVAALTKEHGLAVTKVRAGPERDTALHSASYWGELDVAKSLLDAGADVDARNKSLDTPVHQAALNGKCEAVKLLVDRGADLTLCDNDGNQPLHIACSVGNEKMVRTLLSLGADVVGRNSINGYSAAHVAAREGHDVLCGILHAHGGKAVLNALNDAREQPLHRAAAHGQRQVVAVLINVGADVSAVDANGDTALHLAAIFGMPATCEELVAAGAPIDAVDEDEQTALHLACVAKKIDAACALVDLGANFELKNEEGQTAREIATESDLDDVLGAIEERTNGPEP